MAKKKTNKKQPWSNSLEYRENLYKGVNPSADFDPISLGTQLIGYLGGFRTGQGMPEDEARWAAYLGLPYDKTYAPDSKIRFEGDENYPDRQYQGLSKRAKEEVREEIIPKARRIKNKYNKEWIQVLDTKPNSEYNDATIYHDRQNYLGDLGKFGIREVGNSGIYEVGDKYDFPALIPIPNRNEGTELMVRDTIWSDRANPKLYEEELLRRSNKHSLGGLFSKLGSWNQSATEGLFKHKDPTMGGLTKFGQFAKGFGINSGNIGGIANTAATAIGGLLAGKNKTGVGSAMQTVGSLASNIPGVGGLIGAGVNLAGGLVNAAFGSNLNQEFIDQTEQAAKQQANYVSSASTNSQLMSDYANMSLLSDVNKDDVGSDGWFSNKASDETDRLNKLNEEANMKALASLSNTADNIDKQNDLGLMANYTAYGGPINMKYKGVMSPFGNRFDKGGPKNSTPTQEEYIAEQIVAKKAAALEKSLSRKMPRVPQGTKTGERWNPVTKKVEDIHECGPSCAYTFSDNYGQNWTGSEDFKQNHTKYGWKQVPWEQRQPGDAVLIVDDKGTAKHTMMYDSDNSQGQPLFNHSNGGRDESAIRKKAKYPHHNPYLTYEFVGTPADSTQWINEYKEMYNKKAKGGPLKDSEYYSIMEKVAKDNYKNWGFDNEDEALAHALNDNTYNYRGYYSKYPKSKANADTHWTDEFKTVHHPTFSNESVYSGKKSKFNPEGLIGGLWDGETFIPADWQNKKAEGGELFTNGVTTIGNGGTHEQNKYEGVQMGVDPQGIPNLVEEGEVIFNDYVFSNRLRVPKEVRQKYKLRGVTFADAVKQLQKESEERPNDSIAKNTLNSIMSELTQVQEEIRMKKNNNKYANGGRLSNKFLLGGEPIIDNPYSPYRNNKDDYSRWFTLDPKNTSKVTSYSDPYKNLIFTADMARAYAKNNPNDESLKSFLSRGNKLENLTDEDVQKGSLDTNFGWLHKARANAAKSLDYIDESKLPSSADIDRTIRGILGEPILNRNNTKVKDVPIVIEDEVVEEEQLPAYEGIEPMKNHWLRYAPIVGSGLAVANDLFGGNEPDYSNADMYQRAIEGTNRPVTFTPIFDYMAYKPVDIERYKNRLDANAASSRRSIRNNSGGNRAAYLTGVLSSDYNYGNQLGELMGNIEGINYSRYKDMKAYNKDTNLTNAEMAMKADMANAEQGMQRARMYGSLAEYRDAIRAKNRAEKSANLTNLLQGMGDLGRELTDKDKLRWLADRGVLAYNPSGEYTGKETTKKGKKYGGKLNKKRGGFTV